MKHLSILAATTLSLSFSYSVAQAQILFQDDFQSDIPTTTFAGGDNDPVIGTGDVGGTWTINEYGPSYLQVLNDTVPYTDDTPGPNNFISIYRDTSLTRNGGAYGTGWDPNLTLNKVVQLDYKFFQNDAGNVGITAVLLNQGPPGGVASFTAANAAVWPTEGVIDSAWHSIRILANLDSSISQLGIAAQTYTVSIDGGAATVFPFDATPINSLQTVGFYGAANTTTAYFDDVVLQVVPEPSSLGLLAVGMGALLLVRRMRKA